MNRITSFFHIYRFEFFFVTLLLVVFGSLLLPNSYFEKHLIFVFLILNVASGIMLFIKRHSMVFIISIILSVLFVVFLLENIIGHGLLANSYIRYIVLAVYFSIVSVEIVRQVWNAEKVSGNVILGMMSGYICLGLLSNFVFVGIELANPGSFNGIPADMVTLDKSKAIMNFSFITMLTVGYGDVTPFSFAAQKFAVFTAMMGQFYLVVISAVVIGKFLQKPKEK